MILKIQRTTNITACTGLCVQYGLAGICYNRSGFPDFAGLETSMSREIYCIFGLAEPNGLQIRVMKRIKTDYQLKQSSFHLEQI